jgi:signal transduction histidine kinase
VTRFFRSITGRVFLYLFVGTWLTFILALVVVALRMSHPYVILFFTLCFLALSYFIARTALRPMRDLAAAATRLGHDIDTPPLDERGPSEVHEAAVAFNAMQSRIQNDFRERAYMLAAITHDLQTPVTRLRLRLEKVTGDALRQKLIDDLALMSDTIRDGLDLAQSLQRSESQARIDLDSVLASVCQDASDAGHDVTFDGRTNAFIICSPVALRRCITNLVDNAVKYGKFARVTAESDDGRATVRVRDGGPGIPDDQLENVFDPFVRLEHSRSRETGGTGIGLTIARNIVQRVGGTLRLRNLPDQGLEVTLDLPTVTTTPSHS